MKKADQLERRIQRNESQLVSIKDNYNEVKIEIAEMAESTQEYHISEESGLKQTVPVPGGIETREEGITYLGNNGALVMAIDPNASLGVFAHELKHGYQFEKGQASFGYRGGTGPPFLYDKHDELEAYQRQGMFGSTRRTLPSRYDPLPSGPISIHTINDPAIKASVFLNNTVGLQNIANRKKQAFRLNGVTYIPGR